MAADGYKARKALILIERLSHLFQEKSALIKNQHYMGGGGVGGGRVGGRGCGSTILSKIVGHISADVNCAKMRKCTGIDCTPSCLETSQYTFNKMFLLLRFDDIFVQC